MATAVFCAALLAAPGEFCAEAEADDSAAGLVREILPDGSTLVIEPRPGHAQVAVHVLWPDAGQPGASSSLAGERERAIAQALERELMAATVTAGCDGREAVRVERAIAALGGEMDGAVAGDALALRASWPAASWRRGLALVAACAREPAFAERALPRARARLQAALEARALRPSAVAWSGFLALVGAAAGDAQERAATLAAAPSLRSAALRQRFYRRFPTRAIAVVGDVEPAAVLAEARRLFASRRVDGARAADGEEPRSRARRRAQQAPAEQGAERGARERYYAAPGPELHAVLGFPGPSLGDSEHVAAQLLAALLERAGGGVLARELRHERHLVHQLRARAHAGARSGYLAVQLSSLPEHGDAAIRVARAALARLALAPIAADELAAAKSSLLAVHRSAIAQPTARAAALAFFAAQSAAQSTARGGAQTKGDPLARYLDYEAALAALGADEMRAVAARIIDWQRALVVVARPPLASPAAAKRARGVERKLPRERRRRRRSE
ncbi:M16 family metallopeptidase [Haliangium ochraceum]|uniref:M16 family metallopeptidase n=1 Tax=Haliangium ochraceum TaxID=80816 RepID=UPI0018EFB157|nr:insulinase family protein [Haliangium ochraceum]